MKIAYDSQIFFMQTYGGVSRYFCEIASRIAKEPSVQVSIIAPMHSNAYLAHVPPGIVSGFPGPKTDRFQTNYGANYPHRALRGLGLLMGDWMLHAMKPLASLSFSSSIEQASCYQVFIFLSQTPIIQKLYR